MNILSESTDLLEQWYVVATVVEVTIGPVGRSILGQRMVAYRDPDGEIIVARDRCPHREAPLSCGAVEHGILRCCYHGWAFGAGGQCVEIPSADPQFPIPGNAHLTRYTSLVRYGLVWVCPGEAPRGDIPVIDEEDDKSFRRVNNPVQTWRTSATRMTDNFLDIAHFPWVHTGTFGNRQRTRVPPVDIQDLPGGFTGYEYSVVAENPAGASLTSGIAATDVSRRMSTGYHLPFAVRSTIAYESGLKHILLLLPTPIDDETSYFTFVVWRNDDFSVSAEDIIGFDRSIGEEDRIMLERLSGVLPLEPRALANTHSDKASSAWRHAFRKLLNTGQ